MLGRRIGNGLQQSCQAALALSRSRLQPIYCADDLVDGSCAHFCEQLPSVRRQHAEVALHHLRSSGKTNTQLFVLGCNSHWARIQVALSSHHATNGQQRSRGKPEFFRTQQGCNHNVACELQAAIDALAYTRPQPGTQKCVVRIAQSDLPWQTSVLNGSQRGRAGPAIAAADGDNVSSRFCQDRKSVV